MVFSDNGCLNNQLIIVKNPNWQEADQLAINYTKCSQGNTRNPITNLVCSKAKDLKPRITRLHSATPTYQYVLLFDFSKNYPQNCFLFSVCKLIKDDLMFWLMSALLYQYKPLALSNTQNLHA